MRDHVWSMLRPKHMLKWRQRHVIDYTFSFSKEQFFPLEPRPYTPCVQEVQPGVWLLPTTERVVDAFTGKAASSQDRWLLCQHVTA
jgi:proteinaceous RNase P